MVPVWKKQSISYSLSLLLTYSASGRAWADVHNWRSMLDLSFFFFFNKVSRLILLRRMLPPSLWAEAENSGEASVHLVNWKATTRSCIPGASTCYVPSTKEDFICTIPTSSGATDGEACGLVAELTALYKRFVVKYAVLYIVRWKGAYGNLSCTVCEVYVFIRLYIIHHYKVRTQYILPHIVCIPCAIVKVHYDMLL